MPARLAKYQYEVIVGNIGTVYSGMNGFEANKAYNSDYSNTRAEGSVVLMKDGEISKERNLPCPSHKPTQS